MPTLHVPICRSLLCPRKKQSGRVQEQSINAVFEPELVKLGRNLCAAHFELFSQMNAPKLKTLNLM